jgi:hypothetical protein
MPMHPNPPVTLNVTRNPSTNIEPLMASRNRPDEWVQPCSSVSAH